MRKYIKGLENEKKSTHYKDLIRAKKDDGTFDKIKKAESLRGKISITPTDSTKAIAIQLYKSLEPTLYLEPHKKLQERVEDIKQMKAHIRQSGRPPTH